MEENREFIKNFSNSIQLSGLVATKIVVKEIKRENGQISLFGSFILIQNFIGYKNYKYNRKYICQTRSPKVIELLQNQKKQVYITCLGKIDYYWSEKLNQPFYYPLIEEISIENICAEDMGE